MVSSDIDRIVHGLAEAIEAPADQATPLLRKVLVLAKARGAYYTWIGDRITIGFPDSVIVLSLSVADDPQSARELFTALQLGSQTAEPSVDQGPASTISMAEVARVVNGGILRREIDEAVDWDPELAV